MKKMKKIVTLLMAGLMCFGTFSGCGKGNGDGFDENKSTLVIGYQDGGFRQNWLDTWCEDFAEMYKDYSFEEGKTGIQFDIRPSKRLASSSAATEARDEKYHIVFNEQSNHTDFFEKIDVARDITDIVTTPLTEFGETKTIAEKLSLDDQAFFGNNADHTENAYTYYTLPWFEAIMGIYYDVDLFEQKGYYISAPASEGGNPDSYGCVRSKTAKRGNGPDGKTGVIDGVDYSYDDGLPATYEEFFKMCDKIYANSQTPIIWSGHQVNYMPVLFQSVAADFDGYEQTKLKFTLDGTATNLISVDSTTGAITRLPDQVITSETGYWLAQQEGNYQALKFFDQLINTLDPNDSLQRKYLNKDQAFGNSVTHTAAQGLFVGSKYQDNAKTIAMIADGSWWYNEATSFFNMYSSIEGAGMKERKIGLMPMPKASSDRLGESTYVKCWLTNVFISKYTPDNLLEAAELFFRYIHTDKALSSFTRDANGVRPFTYQQVGDDASNTSYYAKDLLRIHNTQKIVNTYSLNNVVKNNTSAMNANYTSKYGNEPQNILYKKAATPAKIFNSFSEFLTASQWESLYGVYYK